MIPDNDVVSLGDRLMMRDAKLMAWPTSRGFVVTVACMSASAPKRRASAVHEDLFEAVNEALERLDRR